MAYFKVGDLDFSPYVNKLTVETQATYTAQTNAAGNSVVDFINTKRTITVGIIPLNALNKMKLQQALAAFSVSISFLNPNTNVLEENVACIIPAYDADYYTIQANKTLFNAATLTFTEL